MATSDKKAEGYAKKVSAEALEGFRKSSKRMFDWIGEKPPKWWPNLEAMFESSYFLCAKLSFRDGFEEGRKKE